MKTKDVVERNGKIVRSVTVVMVLILVALLVACSGAQSAVEPAAVEIGAVEVDAQGSGANGVERLSFSSDVREIVKEGALGAADHAQYVFWGNSGQVLSVTVTSPQEDISFQLEGADFKQRYKPGTRAENRWEGTLILSQDHLLTIHSGDTPAEYRIELAIAED